MDREHTTDTNGDARQPADTVRDGAVKITLWENQTKNGPMFNAVIAKTYEDRRGELRDSTSLTADDLLKVQQLIPEAYQSMRGLQREAFQEHDRGNEQAHDSGRADRQAEFHQQRGARGGGGGRSPVPRRDGGQLINDFRPSL